MIPYSLNLVEWFHKYRTLNICTQGVQEFFFCELKVLEIGAFMELFTVMIWLI